MAPKKASVKKASLKPVVEAEQEPPLQPPPPPPPPRDPLQPLTFEELWFDDEAEIEGEEQKQRARELKVHIQNRAVETQKYLEDSNVVVLLMQALQHLIVDRPRDPFTYLAKHFRAHGPTIEAELERARQIDAKRRAKREADAKAALDDERAARAAREAEAKAKRDKDIGALAAAAKAAAQAALDANRLAKATAAAEKATEAFSTGPKVDRIPEKPAKKKAEWKK